MEILVKGLEAKNGDLIGYTKSSKPIYKTGEETLWSHDIHKDYDLQDHKDAKRLTERLTIEAEEIENDEIALEYWNQSGHHKNVINRLKNSKSKL